MEIYTGDFYSIVEEYVESITTKCDIRGDYYVVGDELHACVGEIREKICDRLVVEFHTLIKKHESGIYDKDFESDLFKIINDL